MAYVHGGTRRQKWNIEPLKREFVEHSDPSNDVGGGGGLLTTIVLFNAFRHRYIRVHLTQ